MSHVQLNAVDEKPQLAAAGTQIANPRRAVLRTIVAVIPTLVVVANVAAGVIIGYLNEQTDVAVPAVVFVWLNAVLAGTTLVIGLTTRLLAAPAVNAFVQRYVSWLAPLKQVARVERADGAPVRYGDDGLPILE